MASRKKFKKELSYVTDSLLLGCYITELTSEKEKHPEIEKLKENVFTMHYELMFKIRDYKAPVKEQNKCAGKYFKELRTELKNTANTISNKLTEINKMVV